MSKASKPSPPPSIVAAASAATGLASDPYLLRSAVRRASDATGLADGLIVHDYWLIRSLHGLSTVLPHNGAVVVAEPKKKHPDRRVGTYRRGARLPAIRGHLAGRRRRSGGPMHGVVAHRAVFWRFANAVGVEAWEEPAWVC